MALLLLRVAHTTAMAIIAVCICQMPVRAETLAEALVSAYLNNPTLNAQRAQLRATDEGVPQALSGYRPSISGSASLSATTGSPSWSRGASVTIEQPVFAGHRTTNGVKIAETAVLAGRESLRGSEQDTLFNAVNAFMNLVQAQAVLNLRRQNVEFLNEQVRAAQDRLNVGEGTRTDVAQTNARLAAGQSDVSAASASLNAAIAVYQQVIGHMPRSLGRADSVDGRLPRSLDTALATAMATHPSILVAGYNIDIADYNVKVAEGALLPTASVSGTLSRGANANAPSPTNSASVMGRVSVPIFSGGELSSKVRQAKETLGQRRIQQDASRDAIRQGVITAWGQLDAARAQVQAANAQVSAQRLVLSGVTEERNVGQQTTLDVLNAQQDLLNAQVAQVSAQHDRVVAAYQLLAAIGRLSVDNLGLTVPRYDPNDHYIQVRDKWGGLRTPDGR